MTKTELIAKIDDRRSLVKTDASYTPYVVCSFYDDSKPVGQQWQFGHYFTTFDSAVKYAYNINSIKKDAMTLARKAIELFIDYDNEQDIAETIEELDDLAEALVYKTHIL